ncbi:hypothetical protein JCM31185_17640 [Furfurilactobacillus curtus]|uniref:Energy coupling factor transporter S component ThiW n=2 Tax=Furfurilactobacillus curtus TaxID=1746200 RepID=A0ABQ5JUH0_9LACO
MQRGVQLRKGLFTIFSSLIGLVLSTIVVFPNMAPFQHMVDVILAILVGPVYATAAAIIVGLIRMLLEGRPAVAVTSILVGPLLAWLAYRIFNRSTLAAAFGETLGVGLFGAMISFVVMQVGYGLKLPSFWFYVPYFTPSALVGSLLGAFVVKALRQLTMIKKSDFLDK